jgi:hypothetical protein
LAVFRLCCQSRAIMSADVLHRHCHGLLTAIPSFWLSSNASAVYAQRWFWRSLVNA